MTPTWHPTHTETPPTIDTVTARWCETCNRMILRDDATATPIGEAECAGVQTVNA